MHLTKKINRQHGFIPAIVVIALLLSAALGGLLGFKLGDGTFFSLGIGIGIVLIPFFLFYPRIEKFFEGRRVKSDRE